MRLLSGQTHYDGAPDAEPDSCLVMTPLLFVADSAERRSPLTDYCRASSARTALNVPCFDGLSPTDGENSTSPVIECAVSNLPRNTIVPASRPTLPSINSTGPENVTEFPPLKVHFASETLADPQTFDCGSAAIKVPFPSACASKRTERCSSLPNVISTFHLPIMFGESASAKRGQQVLKTSVKSNGRAAFTLFLRRNLIYAQIPLGFKAALHAITAGTHELFSEFPTHPSSDAPASRAISTGHQSPFTVAAAASVEFSASGKFSVLG